MNYDFIDTTLADEDDVGIELPAEAVSLNGVFLEDIVSGYRTLYTQGREATPRALATVETNSLDGSFVKGSRYPARTITVGFQLACEDAYDFREKFNALNVALDLDDATIIFNDEPDKFYIGTPIVDIEVQPGRNTVTGEFQIFCADPFKYSVRLFEAVPESDGNIYIDYNGTHPAHPQFHVDFYSAQKKRAEDEVEESVMEYYLSTSEDEAVEGEWLEDYEFGDDSEPIAGYLWRREHRYFYDGTDDYLPSEDGEIVPDTEVVPDPEPETTGLEDEDVGDGGDCGYVAIFDEDENIIQVGNPEEPDTEEHPASQSLINNAFSNSGNWNATMQSLWPTNTGKVPSASFIRQGSMAEVYAGYYTNMATTSGNLMSAKQTTQVTVTETETKKVNGKNKKVKVKNTYNKLQVAVSAVAKNRTTNAITLALTVSVKALLKIQSKAVVTGNLTVNGTNHTFRIKSAGTAWAKGKTATIKPNITISGLATTTAKLTGIKFSVTRSGGSGGATLGQKSCNDLPIPTYAPPNTNGYYLKPSSYGTAQTNKYTGPTISRSIPADASGTAGASIYRLTWKAKLSIGKAANDTQQLGAQAVLLTDAQDRIAAGVVIRKTAAGTGGKLDFYVNNKVAKTVNFDCAYIKKELGTSGSKTYKTTIKTPITKLASGKKKAKTTYETKTKTTTVKITTVPNCLILATGNSITFDIGGIHYTAKVSSAVVKKVTFGFFQYSNKPPLQFNGIYNVSFVKDACMTFEDIPNAFKTGDVLDVDCGSAEITVNGERKQSLGALGNDWETFLLYEGMNQIGFSYSSWVDEDYKPTLKVRYREVYI